MKKVLIIGSGISGMTCAVRCAEIGIRVLLVSPFSSERSQSVMAAGGINAVTSEHEEGDSVACHIEDTLKGGAWLGGRNAVTGLCTHAEEIMRFLETIGTVFSVDANGRPLMRAFGGQSHKRTYYSGSSTGKHIVSGLVMEVRRYEAAGMINRQLRMYFHSALIKDGICYGALLFDEKKMSLTPVYADAVVIAVGGQNALFGKTTGSRLCDGYAVGRLFRQGALLKNLEFIQYHPTTLETPQKRMMISESARGEGGRLFTVKDGQRCWFLEEKYGTKGNLMTRDIVSREIYSAGSQVYLDVSFLGKDLIKQRLGEVSDICRKFRNIDITKEPIPVEPSVHFFMGGLAVHLNHETCIRNLYAVGECASMYHGANRLGGNSLLAAVYSGCKAADDISSRPGPGNIPDFSGTIKNEEKTFAGMFSSQSSFPVMYIRDMMAETMQNYLGIVRIADDLKKGIGDIDYYLSIVEQIHYDSSVSAYTNYSLECILSLAKAVLICAEARKESRGAHYRSDFPESSDDFSGSTLVSFDGGSYRVWLDKEGSYEN